MTYIDFIYLYFAVVILLGVCIALNVNNYIIKNIFDKEIDIEEKLLVTEAEN